MSINFYNSHSSFDTKMPSVHLKYCLISFLTIYISHSLALIVALVVIIVAAVALLTIKSSIGGNTFILSAAFLVIILCGGFAFFGKSIPKQVLPKVKEMYNKLIGKKTLVHVEEISHIHHKAVYVHPLSRKTSIDGETNSEVAMLEVLCKEKNRKDRERACHRQICHWRAMLSLLSEEMIDGYGMNSGQQSAVLPVAPLSPSNHTVEMKVQVDSN